MNNRRREKLLEIASILENANLWLSGLTEEEQECLDNMPENLLESEKCIQMEDNIDTMEDLSEQISSIIDEIKDIVGR